MMRIGAVILAAGGSSRLGQPKQLLVLDGEPLLRRIARSAVETGASPVVVVLGAVLDPCRNALEGLDVRMVENPRWQDGMGTSVAAGVAALGNVDAAMLLVCDQPGITLAALRRLIAAFTGPHVIAARYAGTVGTPAIFPSTHFSALCELSGDTGARRLLRQNGGDVIVLDLPEAELDVDTEGDWAKIRRNRPD